MNTFNLANTLPSGNLNVGLLRKSFIMLSSTTRPTDDVNLTISHSQLSSGKIVELLVNGKNTGQYFSDSATDNEYFTSYTPNSESGERVELRAVVKNEGMRSQTIAVVPEGKGVFSMK